MDTPSATTTPTAPLPRPPRRWPRRWLRRFLAVAGVMIIAVILLFVYLSLATGRDWAAAEEETDALDQDWRLMEMEARRPKIPDAENSALHIISLTRAGSIRVTAVPKYDQIFEGLKPAAQMNAQQTLLIRTELGKIAKPLKDARLLKDMPNGRFPITYADDFLSTLLPNHQNARDVADWLKHDAWLLAQDEQIDAAVESCQALVNAGRATKDDPILICMLIRVGIQNIAVESLERVLAQGQASEPRLAAIQKQLEKELKESSWLTAVRGERAGNHHLFTNLRAGKASLRAYLMGRTRAPGMADRVHAFIADTFSGVVLKDYPDHLRNMNNLVEIAKMPIPERDAKIKEWEAKVKSTRNMVTRNLGPAMIKVHQADARTEALLRSAVAALACERYRLTHGEWPAALEALVQEKWLAKAPSDPFDSKPLRYRRHADGVVVYSIGLDLADNNGTIDRGRPPGPGVDIGFRLWDPSRRRQPPPPIKANP